MRDTVCVTACDMFHATTIITSQCPPPPCFPLVAAAAAAAAASVGWSRCRTNILPVDFFAVVFSPPPPIHLSLNSEIAALICQCALHRQVQPAWVLFKLLLLLLHFSLCSSLSLLLFITNTKPMQTSARDVF